MKSSQRNQPLDILLVEDNPGDVRLVEEALSESLGRNRLHVARDGMEAMEFLRQQGRFADAPRPSLIIMDLNLPKKTGGEVLLEVKSDRSLKYIPVLILSGSQQKRDIVECYQRHANCYITKPADLDQYMHAIRSIEEFWLSRVELPTVKA